MIATIKTIPAQLMMSQVGRPRKVDTGELVPLHIQPCTAPLLLTGMRTRVCL
jgi:hypothetical protein